MKRAKDIASEAGIEITSRETKRIVSIEAVRSSREEKSQEIGFHARPFIRCGLPIKRPKKGVLVHVRHNGKYLLRVTGDPELGLPFGQDRLIPLWVATLAVKQNSRIIQFSSAAEMLESLGLPKDGRAYRRLMEGFKRVFASTIFFGTEEQLKAAAVWDRTRFHFFDRLQLWFSRDLDQNTLPADLRYAIALSEAFWNELKLHPIPVNWEMVRAFANAPAKLDFFLWLSWRCYTAKEAVSIPLFSQYGLLAQLGVEGYGRERKFRQTVKSWLKSIRAYWPQCPATISEDGESLQVRAGREITTSTSD